MKHPLPARRTGSWQWIADSFVTSVKFPVKEWSFLIPLHLPAALARGVQMRVVLSSSLAQLSYAICVPGENADVNPVCSTSLKVNT